MYQLFAVLASESLHLLQLDFSGSPLLSALSLSFASGLLMMRLSGYHGVSFLAVVAVPISARQGKKD